MNRVVLYECNVNDIFLLLFRAYFAVKLKF